MKLNDVLEIEPLSKALQRPLRLAHENGASELATWLQLEIGGRVPGAPGLDSETWA